MGASSYIFLREVEDGHDCTPLLALIHELDSLQGKWRRSGGALLNFFFFFFEILV